jgi:hypothetical protein
MADSVPPASDDHSAPLPAPRAQAAPAALSPAAQAAVQRLSARLIDNMLWLDRHGLLLPTRPHKRTTTHWNCSDLGYTPQGQVC